MAKETDGVDFMLEGLRPGSDTHPADPHAPPAAHPVAEAQPTPVSALVFPLFQPPLASYRTGGRFFGAHRSGRLHAAVDLLNPHQARIRAISDGTVISSATFFYQGTNELEIHHPGVGVVRYGEIDPVRKVDLKPGDKVRKGDVVAYVGRLTGNGASMLHFELYKGTAKGPLTVRTNAPYQRRSDLENPTSFIDDLLKQTFGS